MMEQQLVDYIKKAKAAGQPDQQTRSLLHQNGWTDAEINEAFSAADQPKPEPPSDFRPQLKTEPQTGPSSQYQVSGKPDINLKTAEDEPEVKSARGGGVSHLALKILTALILLCVISVGAYFAFFDGDIVQDIVDKTISYFSPSVTPESVESESETTSVESSAENPPATEELVTKNLAEFPQDYVLDRISVAAFSQNGDNVVYCAPHKTTGVVSCFRNEEKFLESPYGKKPYWLGISPNGQRIVFLFYDTAKKESFVFENGAEGARYSGTITSPKFSDDSKNFMFMVLGNNGKSFVVANQKQFSEHDKIFTTPELSDNGKYVVYGAMDGGSIMWIADKIPVQ